MCPDEADISSADSELDYPDKAVVVASYIEHIVLIPDIIRCREIFSDVRKGMPFGLLSDVIPTL